MRTAAPLPQALADYFASKMTLPGEENQQVPPLQQLPDGAKRLRSLKITNAMVTRVLFSLDELKASGPDGVSPRLLKHCAGELARPLTNLFQKVAKAAEFPKSWKVARVTPVYKKVKVTEPQNYRPVSVLPTLATTFERVVMPQFSAFLLPHIPEEQFGLIPGTGTLDVGVVLADQIARALQSKKITNSGTRLQGGL
jgi:hypothetical protein